jgi:hypothetical protein
MNEAEVRRAQRQVAWLMVPVVLIAVFAALGMAVVLSTIPHSGP